MKALTVQQPWASVVSLQGCHTPSRGCCEPWGERTSGVYHWVLTDVVKLCDPVPCRGMVGLFDLPPEVESEVHRQLAVTR